jgi:hypothetical protein
MTINATQQAALEKAKVGVAVFLELQFVSGTLRLCNYTSTFTWGGNDWQGLGSLGSVSALDESAGVGSSAMTFGLNITSAALLAIGVGAVEDYRGQPAKLYFTPLDENDVPIFNDAGEPDQCWRGTMDVISTGVDGEDGQIVLKCETSAFGLKRSSLRLNAAQQKQRYPTDTGFDYLTDLIANPQVWLSKKFQQI